MGTGRETSHTLGSVGGWRGWGGITVKEMPDVGDEGMEEANHHDMCVPMQQSFPQDLHMYPKT